MNASLNDLIEQSASYDTEKHDHVGLIKDFRMDEEARIVVPGEKSGDLTFGVAPLKISGDAWLQLSTKLGPAVWGRGSTRVLPLDFIDRLPKPLMAQTVNHFMQHSNGNSWMVRGYQEVARAFVSSTYPRVRNTRLLEIVRDAITELGGSPADARLVRPSITPDAANIQIVFRDVQLKSNGHQGGEYGLGVSFRNDETGRGGLGVYPFVERLVCKNGLVRQEKLATVNLTHNQYYTESYMTRTFGETVGIAFKLSGEVLEKLLEAELEAIPDLTQVITGMAATYKWDADIVKQVTFGTEGKETRAGIVNGLTYAAQKVYGDSDPDHRMDMETLAGDVLYAPATLFSNMIALAARVEPVRARR